MKLKEFIKTKGYSIKQLAEKTGLPYSTVNDMVNGVVSVNNVGLGKCKAISNELGISLDDFYDLYNNVIRIGDEGTVVTKNHGYYLKYKDEEKYIFKANKENAFFVKEVASWDYEDMVAQEELNELAKEALGNG